MPVDPFEVVRKWFHAFNAADLDALTALYHEDATSDAGADVARGRDAVRQEMAAVLERAPQRHVRMIARVETGAMHAEWRGHSRAEDGQVATCAGYDEFFVEQGLIRRQRGVRHPFSFQAEEEVVPVDAARPSRQYPAQPIVGVGAVIVHEGKVVLVKRRFEPLAGQWSLPGGRLELGETLESGLAREMLEETGLEVEVGPVVDVFDRILLDPERKVRYHYVLIDYLCRPTAGTLAHGSDVAAAELVDPGDLDRYRLTPKATAVIEKAFAAARTHTWDRTGR
ncbi:MAG TPA: NUDIX domain-containing protein [Vicinamibacterales bacterium]|nr:NUDIX domain-containing protein [Vicinamibacterales bacterium]